MFSNRTCVLILCLVVAALILSVYMVHHILLPFILSVIFTYLLNPIVNKLVGWKIKVRAYASFLVILTFCATSIAILILIVPVLYKQCLMLATQLSSYSNVMSEQYMPSLMEWLEEISPQFAEQIGSSLKNITMQVIYFTGNVTKHLIQSSLDLVSTLSLVVIIPFITFYLLKDLQMIKDFLENLMPLKFRVELSILVRDINKVLFGYLYGQLCVCCALALYYTLSFSAVGLESTIVLGLMSGFLVFIPYVGAVMSFVFCLIVAALQFGISSKLGLIVCIFAVGQVLEGMFLTPKFVGDSTGLHPIWIIFGLLAAGNLFGFAGAICAVPITAVSMVVTKHLLHKYHNSTFYNLK